MSDNASSLVKIFWPAHTCSSSTASGLVVGWNLCGFTTCVAAIVSDVRFDELEAALFKLKSDEHWPSCHMNRICGGPPVILGICMTAFETDFNTWAFLQDTAVLEKQRTTKQWMTFQLQSNCIPSLRSVHRCGYRHNDISTEIVFYKQPVPAAMQFLSLEPLSLDISMNHAAGYQRRAKHLGEFGPKRTSSIEQVTPQQAATFRNVKKVIDRSRAVFQVDNDTANNIETILNQINASFVLETRVRKHCASEKPRRRTLRAAMAFRRLLCSRAARWLEISAGHVRSVLLVVVMVAIFVTRMACELALFLLNHSLPGPAQGITLKDVSAAAQQVDLRLQQCCFWPWQFMLLRTHNWVNIAAAEPQYINFYNWLWLVANDIIIGVGAGSFMIHNSEYLAKTFVEYLDHYTVRNLESMITWLMGSPAGLKLNNELDKFLGDLFLLLIHLWTVCIGPVRPFVPAILEMIGLAGAMGASTLLSLASDFLSLMTLHVYWFYMVAARIYNWQLTVLYSLFNLFRGKKRNTLRNRIDSCDYDLDQLLLGTILFTLLTFLFPTVVVYYLTFFARRVGVLAVQGVLEIVLACLNHFPLFAIMLRVKDPARLPGGIRFKLSMPERCMRRRPNRRPSASSQSLSSPAEDSGSVSSWLSLLSEDIGKHRLSRRPRTASPSTSALSTSFVDEDRVLVAEDSNHGELRYRKPCRNFTLQASTSGRSRGMETLAKTEHLYSLRSPDSYREATYLCMENIPTPITTLFFQYILLWKRISSHYLSSYMFRCLLSGEPIRQVHGLQYVMLPERKQLGHREVWSSIKQTFLSERDPPSVVEERLGES